MNKIGVCALCEKRKQLRESHIVSKFAFSDIKKSDKKIISIDQYLKRPLPDTQDGPKEFLFCETCEGKRSRFETYFANLIQHKCFEGQSKRYRVMGLDYTKLKLFVMWTIYAYNVSSLSGDLDLRLQNRMEDLADMLNNDDPGDVDEFGFAIWMLTDETINTSTSVVLPLSKGIDNLLIADLVLKGFFFRVQLTGTATPGLCRYFLQRDGTIAIEKISLRMALRKMGFPV